MSAAKDFAHSTVFTSLMVPAASKFVAAALAAIACLGSLQALWRIGTLRELESATELRGLGGTVLWAWRLDDAMQQKQTVSNQAPRWLTPGDSVVSSVYLTNCHGPQLDEKLACLESLRSLRYLALTGTNATDAALVHVAKLPGLEWLDLGNTVVTDDGLRNLAALKRLKYVYLGGTRVTRKGMADLRAQLPSTTIAPDFDEVESTRFQLEPLVEVTH